MLLGIIKYKQYLLLEVTTTKWYKNIFKNHVLVYWRGVLSMCCQVSCDVAMVSCDAVCSSSDDVTQLPFVWPPPF